MTRMMKKLQSLVTVATTAACLTLAACDDAPVAPDRTVPDAGAVAQQIVATAASDADVRAIRPDAASVALRDVLERVLPTFQSGSSKTSLAAGLTQALASLERRDLTGARQALRAADQTLDVYARQAGKALGPDIEAIRLAIAAGL
jgi:hypothetical protein